MAYPHKWSPISYTSSARQRKHAGQRPTFYRWTTQPTLTTNCSVTYVWWLQIVRHWRTPGFSCWVRQVIACISVIYANHFCLDRLWMIVDTAKLRQNGALRRGFTKHFLCIIKPKNSHFCVSWPCERQQRLNIGAFSTDNVLGCMLQSWCLCSCVLALESRHNSADSLVVVVVVVLVVVLVVVVLVVVLVGAAAAVRHHCYCTITIVVVVIPLGSTV